MDKRQIKKYIQPLLRWWLLIAAAALITAGAAAIFLRMQDPVYETRGLIMVGSAINELNPERGQFDLTAGLASSYVTLAHYGSVPDATAEALGLTWLPSYDIIAVPNSQLIQVTVSDTDPNRAYIVATELINQVMALSPGGAEAQQRDDFVASQLRGIQDGIVEAESRISALQTELNTALSARQIRQIEDQIAAQESKLTTLRSTYVGLIASTNEGSTNTMRVVDPPFIPVTPIPSRDKLMLLVAGLLGVVLGIAAAYVLDFFDDRIEDVDEISDKFGMVTLGVIPETSAEQIRGPLVLVSEPHSIAAESFRVLRTNMLFASVDKELKILLVTSPNPGEGKTFVSSNLATAFSSAGKRVILIDADLRKPTVHRVFGILNNTGVSTALVGGKSGLNDAIQKTTVPGLSVMTSGPLPPNPSELLTSNRMQAMLASLSTIYDLVIVDSPPVTVVTDSAMLANRADGVLLVVAASRLSREHVRNALGALHAVRANVLGTVLNRSASDTLGFHYSYRTEYANQYYKSHYRDEPVVTEVEEPLLVQAGDQTDFVVTTNGHAQQRFELTEATGKKKRSETTLSSTEQSTES